MKLVEENIGVNLHDLGLGNVFLDVTNEKIDNLNCIKKKMFFEEHHQESKKSTHRMRKNIYK